MPRAIWSVIGILGIFLLIAIVTSRGVDGWDTTGQGTTYSLDDLVDASAGVVVKIDSKYHFLQSVNVSASDILSVAPGSNLVFHNGTGLGIYGGLNLSGLDGIPILLSGSGNYTEIGFWEGIDILPGSYLIEPISYIVIRNADIAFHLNRVVAASINNLTIECSKYGLIAEDCQDCEIQFLNILNIEYSGSEMSACRNISLSSIEILNCSLGMYLRNSSTTIAINELQISNCRRGFDCWDCVNITLSKINVIDVSITGFNIYNSKEILCRKMNLSCDTFIASAECIIEDMQFIGITIAGSLCTLRNISSDLGYINHSRISISNSNVTITNLNWRGMQNAGLFVRNYSDVFVYNTTFRFSLNYDVIIGFNSWVRLFNSTLEKYRFYEGGARISFLQTNSVYVCDAWGLPIDGCVVSLESLEGAFSITCVTAIDGWAHFPSLTIVDDIWESFYEVEGEMLVQASIGWLVNNTVVIVNASHVLQFTLRDLVAPLIDVEVPTTVDAGTYLAASAEGSTDNDPNFPETGNATWNITGPKTAICEYTFSIRILLFYPGNYSLNLTLRDRHGNAATHEFNVSAIDVPPPTIGISNLTVRFGELARMSTVNVTDNDPAFPLGAMYEWTLDLGGAEVVFHGYEVSYRFENPGNYTCRLNVTDAAGNMGSSDFWVLVIDQSPPSVDAGADITAHPGETVWLIGRNSTDDDRIARYLWTIEIDPEVLLEGDAVEYVFNRPGSYHVVLKAWDPSHNEASDDLMVHVESRIPRIILSSPINDTRTKGLLLVSGTVYADFVSVILMYRITNHETNGSDWITTNISRNFTVQLNITAKEPGQYMLELYVDDSFSESERLNIRIILENDTKPPVNGDDNHSGLFKWITLMAIICIIIVIMIALLFSHRKRG